MKKWVLSYLLVLFLSPFADIATALAVVSDDFSGSALNTSLWTFVNPRGDAKLSMTGTQAAISLPSRTSHDAWYTDNYEARIMQPANNSDFELEVKFESSPSGNAAMNGITIEQDSRNYLRFEFYSNSTKTMIFAAFITPADRTIKNNVSINATPGYAPLYMRVKRAGDQWTQSYSLDGSTWTQSVTFTQPMIVTAIGASAGNAIGNPAYTSLIDYFFNTSSPIEPQDVTPTTINIWYGLNQKFGQIGIPQMSADILGNVSNPSRISSLTYLLNGVPKGFLSLGPNSTRLQNWGDFNANISFADLVCGNNIVEIKATDDLGHISSQTVNLQYDCNSYWPETYSIDWSTVTNIQDVAQVVDGIWEVQGGVLRPVRPGYDRLVAIGEIDPAWDDYEITVPITFFNLDPTVPWGPLVGVIMRWQGHNDWDGTQPPWGWWPIGGLGGYGWVDNKYKLQIIGNNTVFIAKDNSGRHLTEGVPYIFKMRVETEGNTSIYSLKVWEKSSPEPAGWDISGPGPAGELKYGSAMLMTHYVDADFGNVTITQIPLTQPVCGNGTVEADEQCDDGNLVNGDGCSSTCKTEFCGDGVLQPLLGEHCDDGNTANGDGCSSTCASECVLCKEGVQNMTLQLNRRPSGGDPNERIRVRADSLIGPVLYDSWNDSNPNLGLPVGANFSFNVPSAARQVVVTMQGRSHRHETLKTNFSAECDLSTGQIRGNPYKFKVMDARFDGSKSCSPACTGSIGDFVWYDKNKNGIQDSGEAGIPFVTVTLSKGRTTRTNLYGKYSFAELCAGTYTVKVTTPSWVKQSVKNAPGSTSDNDSNGSPASVTLTTNASISQTIDFGFYMSGW